MCLHDRYTGSSATSSSSRSSSSESRPRNRELYLQDFNSYTRRRIEIGDSSNDMQKLAHKMQREYGLVPLILVAKTASGTEKNFSMYVDPHHVDGVQKAAHDLRSWHPKTRTMESYGFAPISVAAIGLTDNYGEHESILLQNIDMLKDRNTPDSLDFDEKDHLSVYIRCRANGYVSDYTHARNKRSNDALADVA